MNARQFLAAGALSAASASVFAAGADLGQAVKQPTNWIAISMFVVFVISTLFITKWAAAKTQLGRRLLHGGRRHHRLPERPCDRRRLHVGRVVSRHLGGGVCERL